MSSQRTATAAMAVAIGVALASATARAGHHQICYQVEPARGSSAPSAVFECRADDPTMSCSIVVPGATTVTALTAPANAARVLATFTSLSVQSAGITFHPDNVTRGCTVELAAGGWATAFSRLVGYTTDASGLAMTGVWALTSPVETAPMFQTLTLPADLVATGGGGIGAESPGGVLVIDSRLSSNLSTLGREWVFGGQDNLPSQSSAIQTYAIGLKIAGVDNTTLRSLVSFSDATSSLAAHPSTSLAPASGLVVLGGGVLCGVQTLSLDQYATASYPQYAQVCYSSTSCEQQVTSWSVASKDHFLSDPGAITVQIITMPKQITIGGAPYWVESWVSAGVSATAAHPSVAASGRMGEFALTGVGAFVNWQTSPTAAGNLLWKLIPRPDLDGVEAAAKDQGVSSPAAISAYAVGIQLVPGTVPPVPFSGKPPPIL